MFKKSFFLAFIFSTALFAGCQHDPTILNSTSHKPGEGGNISRPNAMNKESVNINSMNQNSMSQNTMIRSETNQPAMNQPAMNTAANKTMNAAKKP